MILDALSAHAEERVRENKAIIPQRKIESTAFQMERGDFPFRKALEKKEVSFITEVKKASPSKGIIDPEFDYLKIAQEYEKAGADAISCLTEPKWFLGSDEIFKDIRKKVSVPMIRKDFTVDEYQVFEAKTMGANAVLLIVSILEKSQLKDYMTIAEELGLDALVEAHDERETETALDLNAAIIGINNRNLKDFSMNLDNALNLRKNVPEGVTFVAESGIKTRKDIEAMEEAGVNAVLVGETLMRAKDRKKMLDHLRGL